jgi:hypothetical protein
MLCGGPGMGNFALASLKVEFDANARAKALKKFLLEHLPTIRGGKCVEEELMESFQEEYEDQAEAQSVAHECAHMASN